MTPVAFGDELFPNNPVTLLPEHSTIGRGAIVTPQHRGFGPEPAGRTPLVRGTTEDCEKPAPGNEPARDASNQRSVQLAGHVNQRVERDNRPKAARREIHFGEVGSDEFRGGHEPTGPANLHVGNVHTGHVESPCDQPCGGHPCAAPEVEDPRTRR